MKKYNVVIYGVQGYVGQTLMMLIMNHPSLILVGVHSRQSKTDLYYHLPVLEEHAIPVYGLHEHAHHANVDIALLATPPQVSMDIVAALSQQPMHIIDLSGAFRLPEEEFIKWYQMPYTLSSSPQSKYGLSPWANSTEHSLIANPGCYATCALMTLIPLLKENIIAANPIIIDAKSGVSGAGKHANPDLMFCEISGNFFPYKVGKHQHTPEINQALLAFTGQTTQVLLTTQMLPIPQGISMSIYADPMSPGMKDADLVQAIQKAYDKAYQHYPFVKYVDISKNDVAKNQFILSLKHVVGTPSTHIGFAVHQGKVTLFSCIDNLLKGAATQAIENINTLYQLPIHTGLTAMKGAL